MEVSVAQAQRRVGEAIPFEWNGAIPDQEYAGRRIEFVDHAACKGTVTCDGKAFTVHADCSLAYLANCARCGSGFTETLTFSLTERFVREAVIEESDEETYPYSGDRIDLKKAFFDNLFLHLPLISVCSEDCQGLCPVCGCNLNQGKCDCQEEPADSRLASLMQLLNDNKEV